MLCSCGGDLENIRDYHRRGTTWRHKTSVGIRGPASGVPKFHSTFVSDTELHALEDALAHPAKLWLDALHNGLHLTAPPNYFPSAGSTVPVEAPVPVIGDSSASTKRRSAPKVPVRAPMTKTLAELKLPVMSRALKDESD